MTKQELLEFIKEAQQLGLTKIEVDGMKLEFVESTHPSKKMSNSEQEKDENLEDIMAVPHPLDELTDEEILFWSTPHGDEIAKERKREYEENIKRKEEDKERFGVNNG